MTAEAESERAWWWCLCSPFVGDESESGECDDDGLASWLAESLSQSLLSRVPLRLVGRFMGDTEDDDDDDESIDDDVWCCCLISASASLLTLQCYIYNSLIIFCC